MIYGVLRLVTDAKELGITVDYEAGDPNQQADVTFRKVAEAIITSGKIDFLALAQHFEHEKKRLSTPITLHEAVYRRFWHEGNACTAKLPSWVPDWRGRIRRPFFWPPDDDRPPLFDASSGYGATIYPLEQNNEVESEKDVLSLAGYVVDTLESLASESWAGIDLARNDIDWKHAHEGHIAFFAQIQQFCSLSSAKNLPIYPSAARRAEAVWRVPVGDRDQNTSALPVRASQLPVCNARYVSCLLQLQRDLTATGRTLDWSTTTETEKEAYARCQAQLTALLVQDLPTAATVVATKGLDNPGGISGRAIYRTCMQDMTGKRPFLSRMGYVGMGPLNAEPGDVIVVLLGASVPFIIRPLGENRYKLLGECYCDGIMDGEGFKTGRREIINLL